jgi:tricorn protease
MRYVLALVCGLALLSSLGYAPRGRGHCSSAFPTISKTQIVFNYAGDLWIVGRDGGNARRLTTGTGVETYPSFSPDGTMIAFTGEYDGNPDVYVMPATAAVPEAA